MSFDQKFMHIAIDEAMQSIDHGGGPFGAVVVRDGQIVGRGSNKVTLTNDPTAHAEILAIRDACQHLATFELKHCELYTSCEPCPMCLSAIYWARIPRIYYGSTKADALQAGFDDSFIYSQINLPQSERVVCAESHNRDLAKEVFDKWIKTVDKIAY